MNCPEQYRCVIEPVWSPGQWMPLVGIIGAVIILIVVVIIIANWVTRDK